VRPATWGAVLAGGRSRRLGFDKARARIGGETLLDRAIAVVRTALDDVVVIGRAGVDGSVPYLPDGRPGLGPLGGILTALRHRPGESVFVLACDLPGVTPELVAWLLDRACSASSADPGDLPVAYPRVAGTVQPLCAVWSADCAAEIERSLDRGERSVVALLSRLAVPPIDLPESDPAFQANLLVNLNRAGDLEAAGAVPPSKVATPNARAGLR
jgi:molybdopterin-guanine dinucleotide biosynthesis protein A